MPHGPLVSRGARSTAPVTAALRVADLCVVADHVAHRRPALDPAANLPVTTSRLAGGISFI